MGKSKIEWTDMTWNPVTGCTPISEGCDNCYAQRMSKRLAGRCGYDADEPFRVTFHPERVDQPSQWKKPRKIFVCSMGDILHQDVEAIQFVFILNKIRNNPRHTFIMATKRPERMAEHLRNVMIAPFFNPPLDNLWWLTSVENQEMADLRIPYLFKIPSVLYGVSVEPMLGGVDISEHLRCPKCGYSNNDANIYLDHVLCDGNLKPSVLKWVICGPETGPNRRRVDSENIRNLKNQCVSAGVPFLLKAMEVDGQIIKTPILDGRLWLEFPE